MAAGFVQGTPCVSGPNFGAMGVHFVLPSRISGGVLSADQPQALIYEPLSNGWLRLVGVEFIVLANVWANNHPGGKSAGAGGTTDEFRRLAQPLRFAEHGLKSAHA